MIKKDYKNPYDLDAEQSVIGGMILNNSCIPEIKGYLRVDDFYGTPNKIIYHEILNMQGGGMPIDSITLKDRLLVIGKLDMVGGVEYIVNCFESVPQSANIKIYADIVKEKSILRKTLQSANDIISVVANPKTDSPIEEIREIQKKNEDILRVCNTATSNTKLLEQCISELERNKDGFEISTGLGKLDRLSLGLGRGKVYIMAAETSHGKTAMALNFVNYNLQRGVKCNYYTYDMSSRFIVMRLAGIIGGIDTRPITLPMDYQSVDTKPIYERVKQVLRDSISKYENTESRLSIKGFVKLAEIESDLSLGDCRLVVVDYIQTAVKGEPFVRRDENEALKIGAYMKECKRLADKYDVCMLILSQFSRKNKEQRKSAWRLEDLKGSSDLEQGADVVIFLEWAYKLTENPNDFNDYKVWVLKNNMTATGTINLEFDPIMQNFQETFYKPK